MKSVFFKRLLFSVFVLAFLMPSLRVYALTENRVPENRVIYEVFVRNFSNEGTFKGVQNRVQELKNLGVDIIWLMPVYELGTIGKWGTYSSPYAIKDYKAVNRDMGSEQDLRNLINAIHDAGMEVWFDWVGNHTSMDNVWVTSHPEYYLKKNGSFVNGGANQEWGDVYQLDVDNHQMHVAMIDAMKYWVEEFGIDGYRCDYASGPSQEFWQEATSQVLKNGKRVVWLAEDSEEPELVRNGWFEYNWTWDVFGAMFNYVKGANATNLNNLKNNLAGQHTDAKFTGRSRIMYTSSHDVVQDQDQGDNWMGNYEKALITLQFTAYGTPVIYNGQEINYHFGKFSLAEKKAISWSANNSTTDFFKKLIQLKHSHPSLLTGAQSASYTNLTTSGTNNNILAYMRGSGENALIVILNLSSSSANVTVSGLPSGNFTELFSGESKNLSNSSSFSIDGYGYKVYYNNNAKAQEPYYIYVSNQSGWSYPSIYAYEPNGAESVFGSWPGIQPKDQVVIDGILYDRYPCPLTANGKNLTLLFSGDAFENRPQVPDAGGITVTLDKDIYIVATSEKLVDKDNWTGGFPDLPEPLKYSVYVHNTEGTPENAHLYGWYLNSEDEDAAQYLGGWPGIERKEKDVNVNGLLFDRFELPADVNDKNFNIIYNNSDNFESGSYNITVNKDYYLVYTGNGEDLKTLSEWLSSQQPGYDEEGPFLYVDNQSNYSPVYIYAWATNEPELFGSFPGVRCDESTYKTIINGIEYYRIKLDSDKAANYNFIVSDGDGGLGTDKQFDAGNNYSGSDIFLTLGKNSTYVNNTYAPSYLVVYNESEWTSNLHLYAYGPPGSSEYFGGWPGKKVSDFEEFYHGGVKYYRANLTGNGNDHYTIIANNGSGGDGNQFDAIGDKGEGINGNETTYLWIKGMNAAYHSIMYHIYVENLTTWNEFYVYAEDMTGKASLYGEWPGVKPTETATVNGITYSVFPFIGDGTQHSLVFNNGKMNDESGASKITDEGIMTANDHYYVTANASMATGIEELPGDDITDETVPVYFNFQGIRVENPADGIFIKVTGNKTAKVAM